MAQLPKFVVYKDDKDEIRWRLEAANADITGNSYGTFPSQAVAVTSIKDHIAAAIGASGASVSLGTEYEPIVEFEGFDEPAPEPGEVTDEEVVEEPEEESNEG